MTGAQRRLYSGILRLVRAYGTGGAAWTGRRAVGGSPAADPTIASLASRTMRFVINGKIRQAGTLPDIPIYSAPYWGVAASGVDVQEGDVYDNGALAFLVTGTPDSSQGFLLIPAALAAVPGAAADGGDILLDSNGEELTG